MVAQKKQITAHGETLTADEWGERNGVAASTIHWRLAQGLPAEEAIRPAAPHKVWTEERLEELWSLHEQGLGTEELAERYGTSVHNVYSQIRRVKFAKRRTYYSDLDTPYEDDPEAQRFVRDHPDGATQDQIASAVGVTRQAVRSIEERALKCMRRRAEINPAVGELAAHDRQVTVSFWDQTLGSLVDDTEIPDDEQVVG